MSSNQNQQAGQQLNNQQQRQQQQGKNCQNANCQQNEECCQGGINQQQQQDRQDLNRQQNQQNNQRLNLQQQRQQNQQAGQQINNQQQQEDRLSYDAQQNQQNLNAQRQQEQQGQQSNCAQQFKQADAQITLYGSLLFECCLKETSDIDIDIQFNKTLPYETLKELLDIVRTSNHCKEAYINTDHDQLCIDMSIINSNILVRITSNNIRAIQLSQIIEIYTKFDKRLLSLLRLFRILAKTCNLDRPDLGTLHPIVFHFMIIHFLQQLDPPILPCLHECRALDYFCHEPNHENQIEKLNISYSVVIDRFPKKYIYWQNVQQEILREHYKKTFDTILAWDEGVEKSQVDSEIQSDITCDDDDDNQVMSLSEPQEAHDQKHYDEDIGEKPVLFKTLSKDLNTIQKEILRKEYDQQVKIFNTKMQQIHSDIQLDSYSLKESDIATDLSLNKVSCNKAPSLHHSGFFYDMKAENFGAEKGAPPVCLVCYKSTHVKSNCPELSLPKLIDLPSVSKNWINIISNICERVMGICVYIHFILFLIVFMFPDQCKLSKEDIEKRDEILNYLQKAFEKCYPLCSVRGSGSAYNGFGFRQSDLDVCVLLKDQTEELNIIILEKLFRIIQSEPHKFRDIELVRDARVPIIRCIDNQFNIEVDLSVNNALVPVENTRLLKTYTEIDFRVSQLGYMLKHLVKICDIGDASKGTLSSYAYINMVIHFLQQIQPPVLPILQQLNDDPSNKNGMIRQCMESNVYFYDNLSKLGEVWVNKNGPNTLTAGELWIEFLRYYTEQFDYEKNVVTIRQFEPLERYKKGWFNKTIAIEDPFNLTHNLADKLSQKNWTLIRLVFIQARQRFGTECKDRVIQDSDIDWIQDYLFDRNILLLENPRKLDKANKQTAEPLQSLMGIRIDPKYHQS
ncbi:unnamed protein product [Adineta steineri]|uniref:PAP-associated domain-containing protein n=2 Tax=Adineta steineri TaxID=433720 RepID=A0A815KWR7_9BILA|nr:unnamed protein product [Adineta steineri]